jgi:xylulokinase
VRDVQFIEYNPENHRYYERLFEVFDKAYNSLIETYEGLASLRTYSD